MTPLFDNTYRIPTARAEWLNYNVGLYHVVICTQGRMHAFGEIVLSNDTQIMQYKPLGEYAQKAFDEMTHFHPYAQCVLHQIMPDHIHCLIRIDGDKIPYERRCEKWTGRPSTEHYCTAEDMVEIRKRAGWLSIVIRAYKASVTRFARENNIEFAWQRGFYDTYIRNMEQLQEVNQYIQANVANWNINGENEM